MVIERRPVLRSYLPGLVFLLLGTAVGAAFAVAQHASSAQAPRTSAHKTDPYECGLPSEIKQGFRFGISFYLIAMLFILFDIEVIFLYPVAVAAAGVRHLRADRDDRLHRAAGRGLRVRLAAGSAVEWR